jgi:protein-tyrosine phosphatase
MATRKCRGEDALDPEQPSLPPSEANEHLMEISGVQRSLISLTGRAFERALLWRLDWYNLMYAPPLLCHLMRNVQLLISTDEYSLS